jgi:S-adenosylmethionine:tRNA ribosyltransferase-isomerase
MDISEYDYGLPKELIAQFPAKNRDKSRLMVINRNTKEIRHFIFSDIVEILNKNYVIIFNKSKVIPARIFGKRKNTGGKVEILLLDFPENKKNRILMKCRGKIKIGEIILFKHGIEAKYLGRDNEGINIVEFNVDNFKLRKFIGRNGLIPLPPYIKRDTQESDKNRYQTVYAEKEGSVASPTAGLHFTQEILSKLKERGIKFGWVILHVSYASFKPIGERELREKKLYKEYYEIPLKTKKLIEKTKRDKKKILAIGTTTCRVLETVANLVLAQTTNRKPQTEIRGWTDLFIYPPYKFKLADSLLTNFHLPKSSLLMLVSAFAGRDLVKKAYKEAIDKKYRFYSYGDCMLII